MRPQNGTEKRADTIRPYPLTASTKHGGFKVRKVISLFALTIPLLLLSGCLGGGEGQKILDLALTVRGEYLAMTQCAAQAELTADYGQRVYTYTLDVAGTAEELTLTVTEPDLIAGITARVKQGESFLAYDDLVLETGPLSEAGLSPMSAIPAMLEHLRGGYLMAWSLEDGALHITCGDPGGTPDTGTVYDLWLDAESHALLRGEICVDGRRCIQCIFTSFIKE